MTQWNGNHDNRNKFQKLHSYFEEKRTVHFNKEDGSWHVIAFAECKEVLSNTTIFRKHAIVDNSCYPHATFKFRT